MNEEGHYDKAVIKDRYMASAHLSWVSFAEEQGWDAIYMRRNLPTKSWAQEKREHLAARQFDILSNLMFERRFTWTHAILKTLDEYPAGIDAAMNIAKAKLWQYGEMFRDYQEFLKTPAAKDQKRRKHPFERISGAEIAMMLKGMKDVTEAKLKALMLDKWAVSKLNLEIPEEAGDEEASKSHGIRPMFTIEGKDNVTDLDLQGWLQQYHDKPQAAPEVVAQPTKPATDGDPSTNGA